jgi:hypothetical protein
MQIPGFSREVVLAQTRMKRVLRREKEIGSGSSSSSNGNLVLEIGPISVCECVGATVLETYCIGNFCVTIPVERDCAYCIPI